MNPTQIGGFIRAAAVWALGYVAAKGWIPGEYVGEIAGLAAAIGVAVWSYYTNKTTSMISAVASSEKVKEVITTREIARADPNPKVTSS
jgi:hypothetical protein